MYLDVEALIIDELVEHEGDGSELADEGRFGLDLKSYHFLLLVVQLQLLLIFTFVHLHQKIFE